MNYTIYHEAKSKFAYMYDKDTVHLRLITSKGKASKIEVLYGDPFFWGPDEIDPDKWVWQTQTSESITLKKEYETELFDHYFVALKPEFLRMKYAFIVDDQFLYGSRGIFDITTSPVEKSNLFNYFNFPYLNEEDVFNSPKWVEDQVWYSIFPERFHNGDQSINPSSVLPWGETDKYSNNQRFGGDLQGIIDKLDYIKKTGFTGIYMTPIFKANTSHKYDTNDYFMIDDAFGDNEKFGELVQKAHKLGIKVTLDAVFNHCGFGHPFWQDVLQNGKDSIYYDCFHIIDKDKPVFEGKVNSDGTLDRDEAKKFHDDPRLLNFRTFAFTPYMPKLNTNNPIMKKHLIDAAKYWVEKYDIDGWRLDVSNEVSHQFWREFRTELKSIKEDVYIVGENWDNSNPWLQGDQYDGVMNYEILFPIWNYFGTNIDHSQYTATELKHKINKVLTDYPKNVLRSLYNLIDSHDTTRIMEICGNDGNLVKLPFLFLFTFPGAPSIYYGSEVGLGGKHDPDNRRCFPWDKDLQDKSLYKHVKKLIQLRKKYNAFKSTELEWIETNDKEEYIIYKKDKLYFILSKRYNNNTITLPKELQNKTVKDIYQDIVFDLGETLELQSYGFHILQVK